MEAAPVSIKNSGEVGGNRWRKQETLALIKIRSEMDAVFRDSNLKAPLWDQVSRKLSELGFHRSAMKCREKFENVYKYNRRTKEGRSLKSDKNYRFSDQLQALESNQHGTGPLLDPLVVKPSLVYPVIPTIGTIPSTYHDVGADQSDASPISVAVPLVVNNKRSFHVIQPDMSGSTNSASSSETFVDQLPRKKRRREDFFEKLMKEVIEKQEELQMKFLETLNRRERDRVAKEEAWRAQEIVKMNQERDWLVKERSIVAAKDVAIVTILQKLIGKSLDTTQIVDDKSREKLTVVKKHQVHKIPPPTVQQPSVPPHREVLPSFATPLVANGGVLGEENMLSPSPSRWPKAEINALINFRSQLNIKYQENLPKGPLWEEISLSMRNLGYNQNAKRCKQKWENINKYYKKIKEGNNTRLEYSKTCPYFDQLDAIYRHKTTPVVAQTKQQLPLTAIAIDKASPPQQHWSNTNVVKTEY